MKSAGKLLFFLCLGVAVPTLAQNCPLPPVLQPVSPDRNIFSDQQESDLGDATAEQVGLEFRVVDDDVLTAPLRRLGQHLIQYLPANQFRVQFFLIELPEANAFSLPGGRVYVSRKLVASVRSQDELAGILAHELGHIVTHQGALLMTGVFRQILQVNDVGDRADVFDKIQRIQETWRLHPPHIHVETEQDQYVADQVATYVLSRAGFNPRALVEWWDRNTETHGKTGSWFSDMFRSTKPEQRRLREMLKSVAAMPASCVEASPATRTAEFITWQTDVVAYHSGAHQESLTGVIFKQALALPLRPDIVNLRFSPDGKYILAQDEGGIHVLSRQPLAVLFFIDAPDANPAFFSPDSRNVVFYTTSLRVETWDVATQKRASVHEMLIQDSCSQDALSLDGNFLACLTTTFTLNIFNVSDNAVVLTKQSFLQPTLNTWLTILLNFNSDFRYPYVNIAFSPDGKYLLAGTPTTSLSFDLAEKREVSFPGSIRNLIHGSFAFVGNDRILGVDPDNPTKSPLLRFPTGERLARVPLSNTSHLQSVGHGDYVLVWPVKDHPLGLVELNKGQFIVSFKHAAGDIYDGTLLSEHISGEVTLTDLAANKTVGAINLTQSHLGALRASAVSSDLNWLAVSTRTRGAIWDLAHNIRIAEVRGFDGAWFAEDNALYADFPKYENVDRSIARLDTFGGAASIYDLSRIKAKQVGPSLVVWTPANEKSLERKNWAIEVRDFRTKTTLWSRDFRTEVPTLSVNPGNNTILLNWPLWESAARAELAHYPNLKNQAEKDDYLFELIDLKKDTSVGAVVVKTNKSSFLLHGAITDGDWIAISVSGDRTLVYSLSSGQQEGHVLGLNAAMSAKSGQFAVSTASGDVDVYHLPGDQLLRHFKFPSPVGLKRFSPDGKRLFVLTRDQTAYVLDLTIP